MKEIRSCEIRASEPTADGSDALIINGVPIVFESPTTIKSEVGEYTEIIKRGALDKCDMSDSRLLYNHDLSRLPYAKTPNTMKFNIEKDGLHMTASLPGTEEGRSLYEAIKRGDLTGMSFGFKVPPGGDTYDPKTNTRTINTIEKLYEVSVTPFPCYQDTTVSTEARDAMKASKDTYKLKQDLKIMCNKIYMKRGK